MLVGIDFDNTLVLYDGVFHRCAVEAFKMPADVACDKAAIRSWFREGPCGEEGWVELQGIVYGSRIEDAELAPGATAFLRACVAAGVDTCIVSHKSEYPAAGPRVNLRDAARGFLASRGLFDDDFGLSADRVYFAATREEKIRRVSAWSCDAFVDDLPEVLAEPAFPRDVRRLLYDRSGASRPWEDVVVCRSWGEIGAQLLGTR